MPAIYALLVGINKYSRNPLSGCINDVNAVEEFLKKTYGSQPGFSVNIRRLTDEDETQPTRANVIAGFDYFDPATDGDTCLFYYSGHGSYCPAPREFWNETDSKSESFVCIDSREEGGRDLLDKEAGFLLWKTIETKKNTRFIVITDCCHSGTITKNIDDSGIKDRMMPDATTLKPLTEYLGFDTTINGKKYYDLATDSASGQTRVQFREGNHIHLAASRDNQTAKELKIDGQTRGAFTHSLLKTLYVANGRISYRSLLQKTNLLVRGLVADQHPGLHLNGATEAAIADQSFMTGVSLSDNTALVYHDARWRWCLKAGSIHGITTGDEVDIEGVGKTKVTGTPAPDFSTIAEIPGMTSTNVYQATLTRQPNQPLEVNVDPAINAELLAMIEQASAASGNAGYVLSKNDGGRFI
ncbi:MAG: caspase family protein, partial [Chitinophagaceae bacterium]